MPASLLGGVVCSVVAALVSPSVGSGDAPAAFLQPVQDTSHVAVHDATPAVLEDEGDITDERQLTAPAPAPASYTQHAYGDAGCAHGYALETRAECEIAAVTLGYSGTISWDNSIDEIPLACSVSTSGGLHWNSAPAGRGRGDIAPICREVPIPAPPRLAASGAQFCFLANDGLMQREGRFPFNTVPLPLNSERFHTIASSIDYDGEPGVVCGILLSDKSIRCWPNRKFSTYILPEAEELIDYSREQGSYSMVVAGEWFACALREADGVPVCWGPDGFDAPPNEPLITMSATTGSGMVCGIKESDRTIVCWQRSSLWTSMPTLPSGRFKQLCQRDQHGCGVREDGTVICFGNGAPVPPSGQFSSCACGFHKIVLCIKESDGTIAGVQSRHADWDFLVDPAAVPPGSHVGAPTTPVIEVATGGTSRTGEPFACAIQANDVMNCWGYVGSYNTPIIEGVTGFDLAVTSAPAPQPPTPCYEYVGSFDGVCTSSTAGGHISQGGYAWLYNCSVSQASSDQCLSQAQAYCSNTPECLGIGKHYQYDRWYIAKQSGVSLSCSNFEQGSCGNGEPTNGCYVKVPCGGDAPYTYQLATETATTTTVCQDSPLSWTDMYNNTCSIYAANGDCVVDGHSESDYDLPPSAACCACGGGTVAVVATAPPTPAPPNELQWAEFGMATSISGVGAGTYELISHQFDDRVRGAVATSLVSLESAFEWANASAQPGGDSRRLGGEDDGFSVRMSLAPPRGASKRMMFQHLTVEASDDWRNRFQSTMDAEQMPRGVAVFVENVKIWLVRTGLLIVVSASGTSLSLLQDVGRVQKAFEEVVLGRVTLSLVKVELQVGPGRLAPDRALSESGGVSADALDVTVTSRVLYDESLEEVQEYVSEKRDDIGSSMVVALTEEPFHVPNSTINITLEPEFSSIVFEVGSEVLCQSNYHPCGESSCCPGVPRALRCDGANNSGRPLRDIYKSSPTPTLSLRLAENRSAQFTADMCGWAGYAAEGSLVFAVDMGGSQGSLQPYSVCASRWPLADVNLLQASFSLGDLSDAGADCHLSGHESRIEGFVKLFLILNYGSSSMTITAWTWPVNITIGGPTETSASLEMLDVWGGGEVATPGAAVIADDSLKNVTSALKLCEDHTFSTEKVFPIFRMGDFAYVTHSPLGDRVKLTLQEVLLKDSSQNVMNDLTVEAKLSESWRAEIPGAAFQVELPLCMGCYLHVRSAVSRMARSIGSASPPDEQLSGVLLFSMIPPAQVMFNIQIVGLSHYSLSWNEDLKRDVEAALQAALADEVSGEALPTHANVILLSSLGWAHAQASVAMETAAAAEALAERLRRSPTLGRSLQAAVVGVDGVDAASPGGVEAVVSTPDVVVDPQQVPASSSPLPAATEASDPASWTTTASLTQTAMRAQMVSGSLDVQVDKPVEFAASPEAETAFVNTFAKVCDVATSQVVVTIEVSGRRLSGVADESGTVTVSYDITVPSSSTNPAAAAAVSSLLTEVSPTVLSSEARHHMRAQGIQGALSVVSIHPPTIEDITLTATTTTTAETDAASPAVAAAGAQARPSRSEGGGGAWVALAVGCALGTAAFLAVLCAVWCRCRARQGMGANAAQVQKGAKDSLPAVAFAAAVEERDEAATFATDPEGGDALPRRRKSARCVQSP